MFSGDIETSGCRCRGGECDFYGVGLGPDFFSVDQLQTIHGDAELSMVDLDEQIVIVDFLALEGIGWSALNWVSVGAGSSGHKVGYAAVFVALVVMDVPGEDYETSAGVGLTVLQKFGEFFFRHTRRMAFAEHAGIGTCVGRVVHHEENEIHVGGKVIELRL
jgi:hypothetical protein